MSLRKLSLLFCPLALLLAQSVAGLKWTVPAPWKTEAGARPMRAATYTIPPAAGDSDSAECAVYFFGQGQGGGIDANMERWKGQFGSAPAKVSKRVVHGLPVTTIDVSGNYTGMGGPMSQSKSVKSGYRLLGAIIENPAGNVFFKFTGPAKTIAANQAKFDQLVSSVSK